MWHTVNTILYCHLILLTDTAYSLQCPGGQTPTTCRVISKELETKEKVTDLTNQYSNHSSGSLEVYQWNKINWTFLSPTISMGLTVSCWKGRISSNNNPHQMPWKSWSMYNKTLLTSTAKKYYESYKLQRISENRDLEVYFPAVKWRREFSDTTIKSEKAFANISTECFSHHWSDFYPDDDSWNISKSI